MSTKTNDESERLSSSVEFAQSHTPTALEFDGVHDRDAAWHDRAVLVAADLQSVVKVVMRSS